jgi:hypothetical protein
VNLASGKSYFSSRLNPTTCPTSHLAETHKKNLTACLSPQKCETRVWKLK